MIKQGLFDPGQRTYYPEQANLMKERLVLGISSPGPNPSTGLYNNVNCNPNLAPGSITLNNTAPFFVMSPISPSGLPTTGFCLTLLPGDLFNDMPSCGPMVPLPAGFTITTWRYIHATQGARNPYSSQVPLTGVNFNEDLISFDLDAAALRFQITNFDTAVPSPLGYKIILAFCEL